MFSISTSFIYAILIKLCPDKYKVGNEIGKSYGWISNPTCKAKCPSNCGGTDWLYWHEKTGEKGSWQIDPTLSISGSQIGMKIKLY